MVNLLVDKVIAEKVNDDRKHIKLTIYFDFNTSDIDIDLDINTKTNLSLGRYKHLLVEGKPLT